MNEHDALIASYLDGSIDAASLAQLQDWIASSPENAQYYMRRAALHDALRDVSGARDGASPPKRSVLARIGFGPLAFAAAAVLVACGVAVYVYASSSLPQSDVPGPTSTAPVATLIHATGSPVFYEKDIAREGGEYARGAYSIESGRAQFLLRSRVSVNLRGKTRLFMHNPRHVTLTRGQADFKVPKDATGFTVHLPEGGQLVDLGTAFRVQVDDAGQPEVRVTAGTVAWTPAGEPDASILLSAGQVAHIVDGQIVATDAPTLLAYHDFGGEPSPGHITTQKSLDETVRLVDHSTGDETGIELTITGANGIDRRADGETRPPAVGTPADELFTHSGIDLDDGMVYVGGTNPSKSITLTLTGLDPTERYDLALYGDRSQPADGPERFTLEADAATNVSSTGIVDTFTTNLETRPNANAGHVVRWSDIAPEPNGVIHVRIAITGTNIAYLSALRLAALDTTETRTESRQPAGEHP